MAPKAKRDPSPRPKAGGAKAKPKAGAAKAKAEPTPTAEDPKVLEKKEAAEMFDRWVDEKEGVVKLSGFAECIRAVNIKKCMIFTDEPGPVIKEEWKNCGGFATKALEKEEFMNWWPTFMERVKAKVDEVAELEAKREEEKIATLAEKASRYESEGIWYVPLADLKEASDAAFDKGKTPLIIDNTEGLRSEVFFTYSGAFIVECKKFIMDKVKGKSAEEVLEEERDRFFKANCFKAGQTVVFRLANSAIDVKNTWNSEAFPAMKLLDTAEVKKVLGQGQADNFEGSPFFKMCNSDEHRMEGKCAGVNDKFRVVAITHFTEEDYAGFLESQFPLELCQAIKINVD